MSPCTLFLSSASTLPRPPAPPHHPTPPYPTPSHPSVHSVSHLHPTCRTACPSLQIYPLPIPSIEADEESLLPARTQLHLLLGLPTNRPLLRVASALDFAAPAGSAAEGGSGSSGGGVGGRLLLADVHAGLAPSAVGGSVHLVQGSYDYHHYMQASALRWGVLRCAALRFAVLRYANLHGVSADLQVAGKQMMWEGV